MPSTAQAEHNVAPGQAPCSQCQQTTGTDQTFPLPSHKRHIPLHPEPRQHARPSLLSPLTPEPLPLVIASPSVAGKTDVLLEDIRFLMHFLQTLISQTMLAQDVGGLLKYTIN